MIYFNMTKYYPGPCEFAVSEEVYPTMRRTTVYAANSIFRFVDRNTIYIKDRDGTAYQYTEEEQVVLKLRTVLL